MYELTKLVSTFVYPLNAVSAIGVVGVLLTLRGHRRFGLAIVSSSFLLLWVFSMPVFANLLLSSLERDYADLPVDDVPYADVIVILGGGAFSHDRGSPYTNLNSNIDRYWHGVRLYRAGRGQKVLLSGARGPRNPSGPTEAQLGSVFIAGLGVPVHDQILDNASRTTQEHVSNVAELLDANRLETFLLVTSAIHMRRAEAVFRAGGLDPVPVATDFNSRNDTRLSVWHFIPNVNSLSKTTSVFHEYLGYWFYLLRGWV